MTPFLTAYYGGAYDESEKEEFLDTFKELDVTLKNHRSERCDQHLREFRDTSDP